MINVESLSCRYGDLLAVDNLSFNVNAGEVLGLVGPNGAGKTTTLRMLAGIVQPTAGRVDIAKNDIAQDPIAAKQATGYVPDDPRLFDALTIDEHLELTASLYKISNHHELANDLLQQFDLIDKRNVAADSLSLGMRQKLSICCAYLINPKALIFDEPLTGLDPRGMRSIQESIRIRADAGAAIIISSHILSLVETLCTHVLVLDKGCKILCDSMDGVMQAVGADRDSASLESVFLDITRSNSEQ